MNWISNENWANLIVWKTEPTISVNNYKLELYIFRVLTIIIEYVIYYSSCPIMQR